MITKINNILFKIKPLNLALKNFPLTAQVCFQMFLRLQTRRKPSIMNKIQEVFVLHERKEHILYDQKIRYRSVV